MAVRVARSRSGSNWLPLESSGLATAFYVLPSPPNIPSSSELVGRSHRPAEGTVFGPQVVRRDTNFLSNLSKLIFFVCFASVSVVVSVVVLTSRTKRIVNQVETEHNLLFFFFFYYDR